jgi:CRP-like cAMP-binding protein
MTSPDEAATTSDTASAVLERLRELPVMESLSPLALATLAERVQLCTFARGDVAFYEGDVGAQIFLILEGKMKISRTSPDGRENLLAVLGPGEVFGELSLFDPGPRTATASAVSDCELAALSHDHMARWLLERPEYARLLLQLLARRLRNTNQAMADLIFTDVPGRVAKALLSLADRFGTAGDAGLVVDHGLTQEELAQLVGASRETVNKALADFAARGWIRLGSRSVVVLDRTRLEKRSG